jgi:hypothetical protein
MVQSDGNLNVRTDGPKKNKDRQRQNTQKTGVIHLKELKLNVTDRWHKWKFNNDGRDSSVREPKKIKTDKDGHKRDRWHNLMEIHTDGRTSSVRTEPSRQRQTHRKPWGISKGLEISSGFTTTDGTI